MFLSYTLFEKNSLCCVLLQCQASWLMRYPCFSCLHFPPPHMGTGNAEVYSIHPISIQILEIQTQMTLIAQKTPFKYWTIPKLLQCNLVTLTFFYSAKTTLKSPTFFRVLVAHLLVPHHTLLSHLRLKGCKACFQFGAVIQEAVLNIWVHVTVRSCLQCFQNEHPWGLSFQHYD